jgi:hypothetical protein
MGVDVGGLACYLHRHMACGRQMRGQSLLSSAVLSHHVVMGSGAFSLGVKPRV